MVKHMNSIYFPNLWEMCRVWPNLIQMIVWGKGIQQKPSTPKITAVPRLAHQQLQGQGNFHQKKGSCFSN